MAKPLRVKDRNGDDERCASTGRTSLYEVST